MISDVFFSNTLTRKKFLLSHDLSVTKPIILIECEDDFAV